MITELLAKTPFVHVKGEEPLFRQCSTHENVCVLEFNPKPKPMLSVL